MGDLGATDILGAGAFIVVILKTIFDYLTKSGKKNGNGTSGDLRPEEWDRRIENIVEKVCERVLEDKFRARNLELYDVFRRIRLEDREEAVRDMREAVYKSLKERGL